MADQPKKRVGRPSTGRRPELREVADPDLVAYCKLQQLTSPGFLAGLVEQHRLANQRGAKTPQVL